MTPKPEAVPGRVEELIERLEKASGPDRNIDADICLAIQRPSGIVRAPAYTGSLAAARSLIPDGLFWCIAEGKCRPDEPLGAAHIIDPGDAETVIAEAEAATAELATCIAALRALASKEKDDE